MATTAANVTAAKPKIGRAVYRGATTLTLPTDATTTLPTGFVCLGYVGEEGLTNAIENETDEIKAWGGDVVLALNKGNKITSKFKLVETMNTDVLKAVFGSTNVTGTMSTGIATKISGINDESAAWVVDMILRDGALKRICIPSASITEMAEIVYSDSEEVGYDVTILQTPDKNGFAQYEYIKKSETSSS